MDSFCCCHLFFHFLLHHDDDDDQWQLNHTDFIRDLPTNLVLSFLAPHPLSQMYLDLYLRQPKPILLFLICGQHHIVWRDQKNYLHIFTLPIEEAARLWQLDHGRCHRRSDPNSTVHSFTHSLTNFTSLWPRSDVRPLCVGPMSGIYCYD